MAFCQKCGNQVPDGAPFCGTCGTPVAQPAQQQAPQYQQAAPQYQQPAPQYQQPAPQYQPPQYQQPVQVPDPTDHTADFDPQDISDNKVIAMSAYILGMVGIVIALLAAPESKYASFHSRQALKLSIISTLLSVVVVVLCWTFIVPILGGIAMVVVYVIRIICFFQVCGGKAKDAPLIGNLPFLK